MKSLSHQAYSIDFPRSVFHVFRVDRIWSVFLLLFPAISFSQPIICDGSFFLFTAESSTGNSEMHRIRIDADHNRPVSAQVKADLGYRVAAAGYSAFDQHIYALEETSLEVLRIDASGNVTNLGFPDGLEKEMIYTAGAVSPDGRRFFFTGKEPETGYDKILFSVAIGPSSRLNAGRVAILNDFNASIEDMAFDPVRGILYGYDRTTNKLVRVDWISGQISNYFAQSMVNVGHLGSLFFNRTGQLFGFGASKGSGEEDSFFGIEKTNGTAASLSRGPKGISSDGCGCPYTMRVSKLAIPSRALPCTEILLRYDIINRAGRSYSYVDFRDTLPEGFTITEVLDRPKLSVEASGVGSNILAITEMDLLLDTTSILIRVAVGENTAPGSYASQAKLTDFPVAVGETIYSDDPSTLLSQDATAIEVVSGNGVDLQYDIRPSCSGDGATISLDFADASFQWSTGDSTRSIFVSQPGWYAVTVTTGCDLYSDSVWVDRIPDPVAVDLGADRKIELGQSLVLTAELPDAAEGVRYRWESSNEGEVLDCPDCASPVVRPLTNTTYSLSVTDGNGCSASDSLNVSVIPVEKIFIPNAFSPNGDGDNDIFYLQGPAGSAQIRWLRVFDRWGNLLFESRDGQLDDPAQGWDGRARGQVSPNGVYVWTALLEFPDGRQKVFNGDLLLLAR